MKKGTRYPSVRYHGDVLYYRVKLASGKWTEIRFGKGTPKQAFLAKEARQELEDNIRAGRIDPRERAMQEHAARPVAELLSEYVGHLRGRGRTRGHVSATEHHIDQCIAACGVQRILDLDPHRVSQWLEELPVAARTKNAKRAAVLAFCRWAASYGRAPRNPLPADLLVRYDENADRRCLSRAMTRDDSQTFFAALLDRKKVLGRYKKGTSYMRKALERRAFYIIAANTGLRWRETARLRWCDIDLDRGVVVVPAGQTKNGKEAELPLIAPVIEALREIRPESPSPTAKVFAGEPQYRTWKHDLHRAGIIKGEKDGWAGYVDERGRRLDRKCLRMSFCTWLKECGVDLRDAQRLMRHSTPALTSNIYTDVRLSNLRAAAEKLLPQTQLGRQQRTA